MALKAWHTVINPRPDLCKGESLDTAEFAVHLDQVRSRQAPDEYTKPECFFQLTYLTKNLTNFAAEVLRRLSGEIAGTSPIFHLITQFGGGKTHALTLIYHLAENGFSANNWTGVQNILKQANLSTVPKAATAVFVGQRFDPRGGDDGTPLRRTPWGEIAWQLADYPGFKLLESFDKDGVAPGGDTIAKLFKLTNRPILILMDEVMNYISRNRKNGLGAQFYNFLQNLSEEVRSYKNIVLAVSLQASELEMTADAEDEADYTRLRKVLQRLAKGVIVAAEDETSEIIRRRLFDWNPQAVAREGRVMLPKEAINTCNEYAQWILEHRQQLPSWFYIDRGSEVFQATYPFHPTVLSVFERKWQGLNSFQRTRGILKLLANWVANAYQEGYKKIYRDPLISLGTAPLNDPLFRAAVFGQLGEDRLEGAITTDICGKKDSHAIRLDAEAVEAIKKLRLHRKVSTTIFFESNGGCTRRDDATIPEIRLAVGEPNLDIGNIETVLETLASECYYLTIEQNKYRFSLSANLNKILADRRANVNLSRIEERVCTEIKRLFTDFPGVNIIPFPENPGDIPNRAVLTLAVLAPEHSKQEERTLTLVDGMIRESGGSGRTFKSALLFAIVENDSQLREEARKVLAWEDIRDEERNLDESQQKQLTENLSKAQRDLVESVWRSYKYIALLGRDNTVRVVDLGTSNFNSANSIVKYIIDRLRQDGDVEDAVSPRFLVRNWSPAFKEWSTKSVRDAFFASPLFPRLLKADAVKEAISRGIKEGSLAYVGKAVNERYEPFFFKKDVAASDIEISDDLFIIKAEEAEAYLQRITDPPRLTTLIISPQRVELEPGKKQTFQVQGRDQYNKEIAIDEVVQWTATGGKIEPNGVLQAEEDEGNFTVTATVGKVSATATFTVELQQKPVPPVNEITDTVTSPPEVAWKGEITSQQWMQFYTQVLSKFAADNSLNLTLQVEVQATGNITESIIERTQVGLTELGFKNNLDTDSSSLKWAGNITPKKWMNFYSRVLSIFAPEHNLNLLLIVGFIVAGNVTQQKYQETQAALSNLGLNSEWIEPEELSLEFKIALEQTYKALNQRQGQAEFRKKLLKAYGSECAITRTNAGDALEAAHIKPYQGKHTNEVSNGLLLRADIHTLFDRDLIAINPQTKEIHIAPQLRGTIYQNLEGNKLKKPSEPDEEPDEKALQWRYARCKWLKFG